MKRIQALTPFLANQIAAGEVVERPASVVKELVENSLDANATVIDVELDEGGCKRILVRDTGAGIHPDDLLLAISAHATSKLETSDDLAAIATLGFRGEALASIASIARLSLTSAVADQSAMRVVAEGAAPLVVQPAAHAVGTTVLVEDLFFNTPARRKFLRSERTEFAVIDELLKRFALAYPHVQLTLQHNGRVLRQYLKAHHLSQEMERLKMLCGHEFVEALVQVDATFQDHHVRGFVALPPFSRAQADMQYFFVNGRVIRDKSVIHAVKLAYQDVLYRERHAAYVLFLTLPCDAVDVNVHPTKSEVRFRDSRLVHDLVRRTVQDALAKPAGALPPLRAARQAVTELADADDAAVASMRSTPFTTLQSPYPPTLAPLDAHAGRSVAVAPAPFKAPMRPPTLAPLQARMTLDDAPLVHGHVPANAAPVLPRADDSVGSLGQAIGQLHGIYIVAENADGLVLIDMHAAHERVLYEQLKQTHAKATWVAQQLLLPYALTLTDREMSEMEAVSEFLRDFGFDCAITGERLVLIRSVPSILLSADPGALVKDVLADWLTGGGSTRVGEAFDQVLSRWACLAALHASRALSISEMNALLRAMEQTPRSRQCNHGRPTTLHLSLAELDQRFMRGR